MRLIWIFLGLAIVLMLPFVLFGDMGLGEGKTIDFLKGYGEWAWLVAMGMLSADLVLPVPGTAILGGLGYLYGPWWGALIGTMGSLISANIAYWGCRYLGRPTAERLVGRKDLEQGEKLFAAWGGWMVTLSRWLPLFPEVISCLAGMTRMPYLQFSAATLSGVLPLSLLFAWIGHLGQDQGGAALLLSLALPPIFWIALQQLIQRRLHQANSNPDHSTSRTNS